MMRILTAFGFYLLACSACYAGSQNLSSISPSKDDNIEIIPLDTTADSSSFVIFVRESVRNHYHKTHTELLYILEGSARFTLGESSMTIKPGDFIQLKPGVVHGVSEVFSEAPLKVLSVQSPQFFGKDRHFVD